MSAQPGGSSFDRLRTSGMLLALVVNIACAQPERPLLTQFFSASRLRDLTALHNIATTVFEPREQGTIATFDIIKVAARREGDREFKDVTIVAPVRLPSGQTDVQTWVVTIERKPEGWRVTGLRR